jgi:uncharacterized tellurite resistance protein B-like protein
MPRSFHPELSGSLADPVLQSKIFYLMLSVAFVDGTLDKTELEAMIGKLSLFKHFEVTYRQEVLEATTAEFVADNPVDRQMKVISYAPDICNIPALKSALMTDLEAIIDADGKICQAELVAYRHIQNALL